MNIPGALVAAELAFTPPSSGGSASELALYQAFVDAVYALADVPVGQSPELEEILDTVLDSDVKPERGLALFILRSLGERQISHLSVFSDAHCQRKFVRLCERSLPDICKQIDLQDIKQNYEKFSTLSSVHDGVIQKLKFFVGMSTMPNVYLGEQTAINRIINDNVLKSYLSPYDFSSFSRDVKETFSEIKEITQLSDGTFATKFDESIASIEKRIANYDSRADFLARDFALPFLKISLQVLRAVSSTETERFKCNLRPKLLPSGALERRYPLHEDDRVIRVRLPLTNDGPGSAVSVYVELVCSDDRAVVFPSTIELGTVNSGDFSAFFDILVGDRLSSLSITCRLSWRSVRRPDVQETMFDFVLLPQAADINWGELANSDPYSTEVAQGNEFVGRASKVQTLLGRIQRPRMQSSFITGQKRVGKTSLALEVKSRASMQENITIIYLEYGEYAQPTAEGTVKELCDRILYEMALMSEAVEPATKNSSKSSLAVLTRAADAIAKSKPESRAIIILDEFDEIHQEMYRHGPTAETFFSNLRSLAAKQNVSFMLVGGENMPFIMAAQGDQLNKFVREPVDYFSRDSEWDDFRSLVTNSGSIPISWHDSALNEIYILTNGHPYYTKLLCSSILHNAIESRDADVTADEVRIAESHLIRRLDTNAFAHFWKDGISAERDEAEVIALKRCRLFVAIARARRMGHKLTVATIAEEGVRTGLRASDIPPLLNDLCRREILTERGGQYDVTIKIFEDWLVSYGLNKLVADTLGDELEASIASEEEAAFVTAPEVATLIEKWPLYKGRRVSGEDVRAWLDQVASHRERRLLYKVLSLLRIVSEEEVREKLRSAHSFVKSLTTPFTPANRSQRRFDLIVTYVDGPGKSGSSYASKYAEENLISATCVAEMGTFADTVIEVEKRAIANGIVVVDDIAVTGESLSANLTRFMESYRGFAEERSLPIVVIVLFATREADQRIRETLNKLNYPNVDLRVGEYLSNKNEIFDHNNWGSEDEYYRAKQLCSDIGASIYSKNPFGYGGKALNMVFYDTCPNNTLPLVHSPGKEWRPLFPRIAN